MPKCDQCGTEVMLPFICAYCGGTYCAEHRIPESHHCLHRPRVSPSYLHPYDDTEPSRKPQITKTPQIKRRQFPTKKLITLFSIVLIGVVLVWYAYPSLLQSTQSPSNPSATPLPNTTPSNISPTSPSYQELTDYALSLINSDRQSRGLQNVTLSSIESGQRHADEMLANHFISHWDTKGYKPYIRYTLEGGAGAVSENCAWRYMSYGLDPIEALEKMEYNMMYDDASSNWGHRDNIIDPNHNKVSIGIAYDETNIYLVQDFEDDYISWSTLSLSSQVVMQGTILKMGESISQVAIYFDNPTKLTIQQLENSPYNGGYDAGTYVGMVVSPPPSGSQYQPPDEGILIMANTWSEAGESFNIRFDMSDAFAQHGEGVYTLYLWTNSNQHLTTLSVWN
jgi:uncharacterized protein YkwD